MKRFGDLAVAILAVLVVAGVLMLLQLFNSLAELVTTTYGWAVMTKLLLVSLLFAVAGINKIVLVPKISLQGGTAKLRNSIRYEMIMATAIMLVTAYLSTAIGPAEQ